MIHKPTLRERMDEVKVFKITLIDDSEVKFSRYIMAETKEKAIDLLMDTYITRSIRNGIEILSCEEVEKDGKSVIAVCCIW